MNALRRMLTAIGLMRPEPPPEFDPIAQILPDPDAWPACPTCNSGMLVMGHVDDAGVWETTHRCFHCTKNLAPVTHV